MTLRLWLARKILGTDDIAKAAKTTQAVMYANVVKFISAKLTDDCQRYTNEFFAQQIGAFRPELLAAAIEANKHLTDMQKSQIAFILQAPQGLDTSYLR